MREQTTVLRPGRVEDLAGLESLYKAAFPEEDLMPVVQGLLREPDGVLSLVATSGEQIVGHVIFTRCSVAPGGQIAALLGPLCVTPDLQKQGIGSRLVRAGLERIGDWQAGLALVLGDPDYYGRFGFLPGCHVAPPFALPEEWTQAWQYLGLSKDPVPETGTLDVPVPWQVKALWSA